ncbi:MAG TPA: hypothetical protein VF310_13485, partial [Vicinamibacteria bacterium]
MTTRGLVFGLALLVGPARGDTLAEALKTNGITVAGDLRDAQREITSYAVATMEPGALVAYYLPEASGALAPPLRLALRDAATGRWSEREVDPGTCLGSAVAIRAAGERFLVETHLTPSASCTLVIAPDLKLVDTVPGAALAPLPNGSFLYRRSQVHFAATSGLEIALHDAGTRRSWRVYPTGPPGPVRGNAQASAKALYAELGPGWCAAHNHPCDPDAIEAGVNAEEARVGRDGSSAVLVAHLLVRDPRRRRAVPG